MHRSEAYDLNSCLECRAEVFEARERAFAVADVGVLCFGCALRRGGAYDEALDRWSEPPSLEGLPLSAETAD